VDAVVIEESSATDAEPAQAHARRRGDVELAANRFLDAIDYYRRRVPGPQALRIEPTPVRIGLIEAKVDFDAPDFSRFLSSEGATSRRLFARDDNVPDGHGTVVAGLLVASWNDGGNSGLLSGFGTDHGTFDVIVDRGSDAGITENVATSVRLVQDGARVLNWSWGLHRMGARRTGGGDVDTSIRSGSAFEGYEELLEEFFLWLRREHPDVIVVNSAGNGTSYSGDDDYRLPSAFGGTIDFEPTEAEGLTAPILPSERAEQLEHADVGRSARLDMRKALELAVQSLSTPE
jgi:hypothetical protein